MFKDKWPWLLLALAVFISSLYEYGYWTVFHFRAFEYFTVESLIQNFAYVIISGFKPAYLLYLAGLLPSIAAQFKHAPRTADLGELIEIRDKHPKVFVTINAVVGLAMVGLLSSLVLVHVADNSFLYPITFFSMGVYAALEQRLSWLSSAVLRFWFTYLFLFYSHLALVTGRADALAIITNEKPSLVTFSEAEQKDIGYKQAKFVGILGDSYVLLTTDNQQIFLVVKDHLPTLRLDRARRTMGLPRQ